MKVKKILFIIIMTLSIPCAYGQSVDDKIDKIKKNIQQAEAEHRKMIYDGRPAEEIERHKYWIDTLYRDLEWARERKRYLQEQGERQKRQKEELTKAVEEKVKKALAEKRKKEALQDKALDDARKEAEEEQKRVQEDNIRRQIEQEEWQRQRQRQEAEEAEKKARYTEAFNESMRKTATSNANNHKYINSNASDTERISQMVSMNTSIAKTHGYGRVHTIDNAAIKTGGKPAKSTSDIFKGATMSQQTIPTEIIPKLTDYDPSLCDF